MALLIWAAVAPGFNVVQIVVCAGIVPAPAELQSIARLGSRMPDQFWACEDAQKQSTKKGKKNRNFRLIQPRRNPRLRHSAVFWGIRRICTRRLRRLGFRWPVLKPAPVESLPFVSEHSRHGSAPAKTLISDHWAMSCRAVSQSGSHCKQAT